MMFYSECLRNYSKPEVLKMVSESAVKPDVWEAKMAATEDKITIPYIYVLLALSVHL